jgi:hypothetical protein
MAASGRTNSTPSIFYFGQGLLGHFLRDRSLRHQRHAGFDFHRALDSFDVVELHHRLHLDVVVLEHFVDGFAGGNVRLEADEFLAGQLRTV